MRAGAASAWLLALTLAGPGLLPAQAQAPVPVQVPVPPLLGHVTDETDTLAEVQKADLERRLSEFEARKGSQLAVLIVRTTAPEPIEQYALRVAESWKLGRKLIDDGAILVVAKDDRALRIEVGYGLEGALTDASAHRIIDEVIVPRFRQQDFAGGIATGMDRVMRVIDGEPLPAPPIPPSTQGVGGFGPIVSFVMVAAFVLGGALRAALGRMPGALATGVLIALATWWMAGALAPALAAGLLALLTALFGGMGLLQGGNRGPGGFGGGTGHGGFKGGGGGFGGGGSSGKW